MSGLTVDDMHVIALEVLNSEKGQILMEILKKAWKVTDGLTQEEKITATFWESAEKMPHEERVKAILQFDPPKIDTTQYLIHEGSRRAYYQLERMVREGKKVQLKRQQAAFRKEEEKYGGSA